MKYCITTKAKKDLLLFFKVVIGIPSAYMLVAGILFLPVVLLDSGPFSLIIQICAVIGIFVWTAILSAAAIGLKRWLQASIVKC